MSWLPLSFGAPMVLWGLVALPVIWWLLRLTPPKPLQEVFPPLRILASVLRKEETPHQSPWWLTLLRLLMAALVVLALADPVFNPREKMQAGGAALALVVDNGWASAPDWDVRVATARRSTPVSPKRCATCPAPAWPCCRTGWPPKATRRRSPICSDMRRRA